MSSRKIRLTHTLIAAAKNCIYDLIEPLVAAGADVNGFPGEEDSDEETYIPLKFLVEELYGWQDHKPMCMPDYLDDYMLTFHTLFKCGANVKYLVDIDINCNLFEVIYRYLGLPGVVLFAQYDVAFGCLIISSEKRLSALRAICYNGGINECRVTQRVTQLNVITTGLLKECLMLVYDTYEESHNSEMVLAKYDKKKFLLCAQDSNNMRTVEFVFAIDFIVESF